MNKQDIDKAAAALTGAIQYFSPMVIALNQADEVFAVLSNALKLKEVVEKEVGMARAELEALKTGVETSRAAITENDAAAAQAKTQAENDIANAKAQADAEVKAIKAAVADRTKKAVADSEAKIAAAIAATEGAQAAHKQAMAAMATAEADLTLDVSALENKLAALREQAQKFAAALVG